MAKKFHYEDDYKIEDIKQINLQLYDALKQYNKLKPKASKLREEYLAKLSMELEEEDGIQAASHFKNLKHREMTKKRFLRIRIAGKKLRGGGVKTVEKIQDGETITIYNKEDIEQEIIKANKKKLLQADNTPLRQEPLQSLLGEQGDFKTWEKILKGNIKLPPEGIEEGTRMWFEFISQG